MKKADFGAEYIIEEKLIKRPIVTVNRTSNGLANGEKDLIVCGCCGALMTHKAKYCMGCGAQFKFVKNEKDYLSYKSMLDGQLDGQMSIDEFMEVGT